MITKPDLNKPLKRSVLSHFSLKKKKKTKILKAGPIFPPHTLHQGKSDPSQDFQHRQDNLTSSKMTLLLHLAPPPSLPSEVRVPSEHK